MKAESLLKLTQIKLIWLNLKKEWVQVSYLVRPMVSYVCCNAVWFSCFLPSTRFFIIKKLTTFSIKLIHLSSFTVSCLSCTYSFPHICHYCNFSKCKSQWISLIFYRILTVSLISHFLSLIHPLLHLFVFRIWKHIGDSLPVVDCLSENIKWLI